MTNAEETSPISLASELEEVAAASAEADRGEGVVLTREQLQQWAETGEWPWPRSHASPD